MRHSEGEADCFHVIRTDGSREDFSVRKSIAGLFPVWAKANAHRPHPPANRGRGVSQPLQILFQQVPHNHAVLQCYIPHICLHNCSPHPAVRAWGVGGLALHAHVKVADTLICGR